jgi:hypothetical protein
VRIGDSRFKKAQLLTKFLFKKNRHNLNVRLARVQEYKVPGVTRKEVAESGKRIRAIEITTQAQHLH